MDEITTQELQRITEERDLLKKQFIRLRTGYEEKIKELSILKELGETLRSSTLHAPSVLLLEQLEIIRRYIGFEYAGIYTLTVDETRMELILGCGDKDAVSLREVLTLLPDTGSGSCALDAPAIAMRRVVRQKISVSLRAADADNIQFDHLYLPVLHDDKLLAVIDYLRDPLDPFAKNQVYFLALCADHLATTLVLTRLYEKMLKEENRRMLLSRFFSKTVAEQILNSKMVHLRGERCPVTILFADLRGFTSLSEKLDEEHIVRILNAYFTCVTPTIFSQDGTLDKFMGDGIMAFFGAPIPHEDDPVRAVRTAVGIIHALQMFNQEHMKEDWPELKVSVGVNTGFAVAGYIGSEDHLNYTVIGDAVNVAQRIESIAEPNTVYISGHVVAAVGEGGITGVDGVAGLEELEPVMLKGRENPTPIYRLVLDEGEIP